MEILSSVDLVKKYGFKFTKSLGQNFLTDDNVLDAIVESAEVTKEDFVIEIGPGVGVLTCRLINKAKRVCAVELDDKLIPILEQELGKCDNFELIHGDALKVNFKEIIGDEKSVKVVANLPYYVTTPIISRFLTEGINFKSLTIMIQKEVAERINGVPKTKEYGALSVFAQYYCNTSIVKRVPAGCFIPQPKVDSIVIKLDKLEKPKVEVDDEKFFFKVVKQAFQMRRKTLWNCMKVLGLEKEKLEEAFEDANIDMKRRGETLSIEEFATLANSIYRKSKL
ncbi:16S rRNA (adenine(1518)-N(6)/adenine(1519)-N(6))-dimethyltransferase RsmA [Oceanirhabdus sp. W0125-5]|uniref:16S rRNA (adenine(1518)-N(6)/adenine(1519)-N(6))- dimethyltransferase RsmA n=1 Tax=Oceanirhabdus sp. W0125-5 TaxID=2999116 RepID=UPI0022F2EFCC|nr:16S rRNA (adenine(1518)-N(6)/adenine(1519)-N(6))-dimethyltransferase RsmA [Oceanirhabdus sp. W0125-5]WBW98293.1 16S rRNA (adenine(1518)-N(6)/adenine(1519)-N(6))-dimethyltransferase RsmA [Oceanirhabdus sp. W0125-5]